MLNLMKVMMASYAHYLLQILRKITKKQIKPIGSKKFKIIPAKSLSRTTSGTRRTV